MKKFLAILILVASAAVFVSPAMASISTNCCKIGRSFKFDTLDWNSGECYGEVGSSDCTDAAGNQLCTAANTTERSDWGVACMLNSVYNAINVVFAILLVVAVVLGLYGGYLFMTSAGDEKKVETARNYFFYGIIGLFIAFFARIIPSLVAMIL